MSSAAIYADKFCTSDLPHCLMISNHGMHQWQIIPGLPDTGGQNVFVNQFTHALVNFGYRVTIVNRGGYPHPVTGEKRVGIHYLDEKQRIMYLEDGLMAFVRKEDMFAQIEALTGNLSMQLKHEAQPVDLIISHYWDGAMLGWRFLQKNALDFPHIWIPHSLAAIKKKNMPAETWPALRINERYAHEQNLLKQVTTVASTSPLITQSLLEDYHYTSSIVDIPPCVDERRFYPNEINNRHAVWAFLAGHSRLSPDEIRSRRIITEISRTDQTKRKDVLLKAFAAIHKKHKDTLLITTLTDGVPLSADLKTLARKVGVEEAVIFLGTVSDWLPAIYNISYLYCTPSVMEGFGMSAQEAAACGCPVIASDLVPFAESYLLGGDSRAGEGRIRIGEGGIVTPADDINGFAEGMEILLENPELAEGMGKKAYKITIPYFTWQQRVREFNNHIKQPRY